MRWKHLLIGLLAAAAIALSSTAAASGPPAISVAGWDPARGVTVWRGLDVLRESRELRGTRVAALARAQGAVAYVRPARGGFDVYLTGTANDTERRLARVAGTRPTSVAISPDARLVAFPSGRGLQTVSTTSGVRRLLPTPPAWRGSTYDALTFSPDGALLAFSRSWRDARTGALRNELGLVRRDGRGARSLARNSRPLEGRYLPTFSPNEGRIFFGAPDGSLLTVAVAGGAPARLTAAPARPREWIDASPVFSRDGTRVAFTRWFPGVAGGGSGVFVVSAAGGEPRRVTTTPLPSDPTAPRVGSSTLAWSPDGTRLLVKRHDSLAVVDAATGAGTDLARVGFGYAVVTAYWNP